MLIKAKDLGRVSLVLLLVLVVFGQPAMALKEWEAIGEGFYHLRKPLKVMLGLVDISTHMALCRLSGGRFLVLDTVDLSPSQKGEFDLLTKDGQLIEAVVATHPFHTLSFNAFHAYYPNVKYYGTPRHLRKLPEIQWQGNIADHDIRQLWEPSVSVRIPEGTEFDNPPDSNHFSNAFVFHRESKTVFNDDTIMNWKSPSWLLSTIGPKDGLRFHLSLLKGGINRSQDAPLQFRSWLERLLQDWRFENLCTAHNSNLIGNAQEGVAKLLKEHDQVFSDLSQRYSKL